MSQIYMKWLFLIAGCFVQVVVNSLLTATNSVDLCRRPYAGPRKDISFAVDHSMVIIHSNGGWKARNHVRHRETILYDTKLIAPPDPNDKNKINEDNNKNDDSFFRSLRKNLPKPVQYFLRDSGLLRSMANLGYVLLAKSVIEEHPSALTDYLRLTKRMYLLPLCSLFFPMGEYGTDTTTTKEKSETVSSSKLSEEQIDFTKVVYGNDNPSQQFVSLFTPRPTAPTTPTKPNNSTITSNSNNHKASRLVLFVHGGAWGSGFVPLYTLCALPFLRRGYTVGVLGYRTYPDADANGQVDDIRRSLQCLTTTSTTAGNTDSDTKPYRDITVVGHSSGAHIAALAFATGRVTSVDRFVALAGVYNIELHYLFEAERGVDRISPMAAACATAASFVTNKETDKNVVVRSDSNQGIGWMALRRAWRNNSPLWLVRNGIERNKTERDSTTTTFSCSLPKTLLVHGKNDDVVPWASSRDFARALLFSRTGDVPNGMNGGDDYGFDGSANGVDLRILPGTDHVDLLFHLMFGGQTSDVVLDWMEGADVEQTQEQQ